MNGIARKAQRSSKWDFDIILLKELENYNPSPVNAMVFTRDGKYLLSGGDDETVRLWNLETFECDQVLKNDEWGQVTALTLMYPKGELGVLGSGDPHLCVGSARGTLSILLMERSTKKPFTQAKCVTMTPFSFNDPVLLQAHDAYHARLAVASQSGELKMFSLEQPSLTPLWSSSFPHNTIPADLLFYGAGCKNLLTLAVDTSELCCRDAETGNVSWTKTLPDRSMVGRAALADDNATLLLHNLTTGNFDLYHLPNFVFLRSFPMVSLAADQFIKQCSFLQGSSRFAICGSDSNFMSVVDVVRNEVFASLPTGKGANMTQTIASSPKGSPRVLLAGASGGSVFIWEKLSIREASFVGSFSLKRAARLPPQSDSNMKLILGFVLLLTYTNWAPPALALLKDVVGMYRPGLWP